MNANDISLTQVDTLGMLLAQIAELTKKAEAIKDAIKDDASKGGPTVIEGNLFKATYSESNPVSFDSKKFIAKFGADVYAEYTKTSAVFTVKVTSR
jgi:prefoldin subunit 5